MKTLNLIVAFLLLFSVSACEADNGMGPESPMNDEAAAFTTMQNEITAMPAADLSDEEIAGLVLMREEEKLARDVYLYFHDLYGLRIFENIAASEARHMSAIKTLLDKYGIEDPIVSDARGVFTDTHLADLYTQLTTTGAAGLLDALKVGATIEDLDIKDLMDLSEETDAEDFLFVYDNLTRGSRNHMRAFYGQISSNGGSYEAQFISSELLKDIVDSPRERGGRR
ncbi:MAG: DUF2202 domain-containing protein [Bacteroidota bacterium]|nr:DUF2202 domain-containing protein [Bacteroidota bacterium]